MRSLSIFRYVFIAVSILSGGIFNALFACSALATVISEHVSLASMPLSTPSTSTPLTSAPPTSAPGQEVVAQGHAYDRNSGNLLYLEYHYLHAGGDQRRVRYVDNNGNVIADKRVNFQKAAFAPDFIKKDFRLRSGYRGEHAGNGFHLVAFELDEANNAIDAQTALLKYSNQLVADAGFDNFVRYHWSTLLQSETVFFQFAVPSRGNTTKMRLGLSDASRCRAKLDKFSAIALFNSDSNDSDGELVCFEMRAENWVVNQLLKPIYLSYQMHSKQLMFYSGVSNIRSADNKALRVTIAYQYP